MDRDSGKMYYPDHMNYYGGNSGGGNSSSSSSSEMSGGQSSNYYTERNYPTMRDSREGRSPMRRKMYMESKAAHQDDKAMNDLENYMRDLNQDIMEMISQYKPTSKSSLKVFCMVVAKGDVKQANELYDFMIKGMEDLPMFDPKEPTAMENAKSAVTGFF